MSYFKGKRFHFLALILIALLVIFTYWSLSKTFFQQDEWQGLAGYIYYQSRGISGIINSFFPPDAISHVNPLATIFTWLEFSFFYTNFSPYALLSIFLHLVNIVLLYYFILDSIRNRKIAFLASIFFGINRISSQAVTWVASADSYEIPVAFILLSMIFFWRFITRNRDHKKNILLSLVMLFISLLFHEVGIFLFLFYPIIFFLQVKSQRKKLFAVFLYSLTLFIFIFFLVRAPFLFGFQSRVPALTDISHPSFAVYPYRLISIGLKSFAGSIFPERTLISFSEKAVSLAYPHFITRDNVPNPYITQSIAFDLISYVLSVIIIICVFIFMKFIKDKRVFEQLKWLLIFIPLSFFPYAFVLGKAGYASIIEPKFFYVGSIGVSILIAILIYFLIEKFSAHRELKVIVYLLFGLYIGWQISLIREYVKELEAIGLMRKTLLTSIKTAYPNLPKNVIIFTVSDTAYYGMPQEEKMLPVQVNFGKMLMVWYQAKEKFPECLFEYIFSFNLLTQGYNYCNGRGFGYFRNYSALMDTIKTNKIPIENIIAYSWKGKQKEFKDITRQIRSKLIVDIENNGSE